MENKDLLTIRLSRGELFLLELGLRLYQNQLPPRCSSSESRHANTEKLIQRLRAQDPGEGVTR